MGGMLSGLPRGTGEAPDSTPKAWEPARDLHAFAVLVSGSLSSRGIGESMPPGMSSFF